MSAQSSIRIIGGKWRSRKVSFKTKDTLRPTPDRVRETLFNWLAPFMPGAICLDLYAGSGVLGFEAISRGAKRVITVEKDTENSKQIEVNKENLSASEMQIINKDVANWLQTTPTPADIVFVDPPYKLQLLPATLSLLEERGWLQPASFIYFEMDTPYDEETLPKAWVIWRKAKAGNVYYYLARKE